MYGDALRRGQVVLDSLYYCVDAPGVKSRVVEKQERGGDEYSTLELVRSVYSSSGTPHSITTTPTFWIE